MTVWKKMCVLVLFCSPSGEISPDLEFKVKLELTIFYNSYINDIFWVSSNKSTRPKNVIILEGKATCRHHGMTAKNRIWKESDQ
jgi:hypothetical protein